MKQQRKILVVIPAYNEAGRIGGVIRSIPPIFKTKHGVLTTKIIVVDDGSTDETATEAREAGAIVVHCGAGAATRTGLRYAETYSHNVAYVIAIDADGQHAPDDIQKMLHHAVQTKADMVTGNRLHAGNKRDIPRHRTIGNRGLTLFSRVLFGIKMVDTQTGFRLFKPSVLHIVADYRSDRYGFATEMLWLATRARLKIHELPITVKYSVETMHKGQNPWGVVDLIVNLLWIRISR